MASKEQTRLRLHYIMHKQKNGREDRITMSDIKIINDEQLSEIAGGKDYRVQNSNFCPRCRNTAYIIKHTEADGTKIRECKVCHQEYKYRRY